MANVEEEMLEKLLNLIEEGDANAILSSDHPGCLNKLIINELVFIDKEKLKLTEKGRKARNIGVGAFLLKEKSVTPYQETSISAPGIKSKNHKGTFLILLLFLLISLLVFFSLKGAGIY